MADPRSLPDKEDDVRWTPDDDLRQLRSELAQLQDRCTGCGRFLPANSTYTNKCADCWTTEDDFI